MSYCLNLYKTKCISVWLLKQTRVLIAKFCRLRPLEIELSLDFNFRLQNFDHATIPNGKLNSQWLLLLLMAKALEHKTQKKIKFVHTALEVLRKQNVIFILACRHSLMLCSWQLAIHTYWKALSQGNLINFNINVGQCERPTIPFFLEHDR